MPPSRGRPKKNAKRNISGLRNQRKTTSPPPDSPGQESDPEHPRKRPRTESSPPASCQCTNSGADLDTDPDPHPAGDEDSLKGTGAVEDEDWKEGDGEMNADLERDLVREKTISTASKISPDDDDWVPYRQRWSKNHRKNQRPRPAHYVKGPDVGSKSERTRQRYKSLLSGQKSLDAFGFRSPAVNGSSAEAEAHPVQLDSS